MDTAELLGYLRNADCLELGPLESVQAQTEAIGDPSTPAAEHLAVLRWLGDAFDHWETTFPLEEPLRSELRRLKPLAAKLAITDPDFLVAGKHPLHQMLDTLQLAAVGWQARLGRVGESLRKQLSGAVEEAIACFDAEGSDLAALCARVVAATQKDLARASRMAQRTIETEQGKARTAEAKWVAAGMINAELEQFRVPPGIGEFLKGPWYESAQLVLLKFGAESEQWAQMCQTTRTLLDSLQPIDEGDAPERRQQLFETVRRLPRELRRWLLSVQDQSEVVGQATGMVEFAHMQVLRKQPLDMELADPIPVAVQETIDTAHQALDSIEPGQWFCVEREEGKPLRVQLIARTESTGGLLFANQAGIRVFQQSFEEFTGLLERGKVSKLDSGASFSRSLASAAGIEGSAELDTLLGAAVVRARQAEEERQQREQERLRQEREQAERLEREQQRLRQEREETERLEREQQRLQQEREQVERLEREQREAEELRLQTEEAARRETEPELTREEMEQLEREQREADELQREWDEALRRKREREAPQAPPTTHKAASAPAAGPAEGGPGAAGTPGNQASQTGAAAAPELNLLMGTWLGFHDGDTPLLAKLAVHDREQNNYIFVNRSGIKMRQLNSQELLALMASGMVDVLETRSSFRDEISRAKQKPRD
jgi:hypothetical protein